MMHDGIQYDPIEGQGHCHELLKVGNPAVFRSYLLRPLQRELVTDHGLLNQDTVSKFDQAVFLIFVLVFVT